MPTYTSSSPLVMRINGQIFEVPLEYANVPVALFMKECTPFKSVKFACGEGGCGACAVAILEECQGRPHLRTINSCLAPVYSLRGCSLLTVEGLPEGPGAGEGASLVADRLAAFHASQCGYCTPGFTVACHAALHNAATTAAAADTTAAASAALPGAEAAVPMRTCVAAGDTPHEGRGTGGGVCGGGSPACRGGDGSTCDGYDGGGQEGKRGVLLDGAALLRALDGNLCRCTGLRPIVAACRSLAADVADIEDLGLLGASRCSAAAVDGPASASIPTSLLSGGEAAPRVDPAEEVPLGSGQVLKVPRSLEQLLEEAGRLAAEEVARGSADGGGGGGGRRPRWRLVAGNTAHGVYKDWPAEEAVLLSVAEVPELRRLDVVSAPSGEADGGAGGTAAAAGASGNSNGHVYDNAASGSQPILHIGACVTLEQLAGTLDLLAAAAVGGVSANANGGGNSSNRSNGHDCFGREYGSALAGGENMKTGAGAPVCHGGGAGGGAACAETQSGGLRQWAAETSAHLRRIAGCHVRNSATVGGNLVLAAERALPSDVATLLGAAGAEVELRRVSADAATHGSVVRADLVDFVAGRTTLVPSDHSYVLTAVLVPLPLPIAAMATEAAIDSGFTRFWSNRIADRYSNAAAVANAAVMMRLSEPPSPSPQALLPYNSSASTDVAGVDADSNPNDSAPSIEEVRILVGLRTAAGSGGGDVVSEHNAAKLRDPAAVLLDGWVCRRAAAAEAALRGRRATAAAVVAALEALMATDLAGVRQATAAAIAEGLVAQGLLACAGLAAPSAGTGAGAGVQGGGAAGGANGDRHTSMAPARMPYPKLVEGNQYLPQPAVAMAPVTYPVAKYGASLQAAGTAHFTEDVPVHTGALYGAFVLSARAGVALEAIDPAAALSLPGVVRVLGASDLASIGARNFCEQLPYRAPEPIFVEVGGRCEFVGQAVGLVLARSAWAAQRGAQAVVLMYGTVDSAADPPVFTLVDAIRRGSLHPVSRMVPFLPASRSHGGQGYAVGGGAKVDDVLAAAGAKSAAALAAAALGVPPELVDTAPAPAADTAADAGTAAPPAPPAPAPLPLRGSVRVVSGRCLTPSQSHFYMETQSAVAWPDEDGCVVVHSSCQGPDIIQSGVATALGRPFNKIRVRCRRVGGGFGGKVTFARRVAVVAAVAAVAAECQVRLKVPRNTDAAMCAGRCDADVSYVAVLEELQADPAQAPAPRFLALDVHAVLMGGAFLDLSFIDAAGMLDCVDSVYDIPAFRAEAVLARCNLPPRTAVRGPGDIQGAMIIEQIMEHVAAELGVDPEELRRSNFLQCPQDTGAAGTESADQAADASAAGTAMGGHEAITTQAQDAAVVKTAGGVPFPARLFTVPRMWEQLQREADWLRLKAEVEAFNAANRWRKRGLAMMPTRYKVIRGRKPAYVSLLADGTVQVASHGVEMGQGLFTKVAQVAALTLSEVLPPARRPLDLSLIRIADNSTELLPNSGTTAGSTTSEIACAAVRLACLQLVKVLRKAVVPKMGREDYTWEELLAANAGFAQVCPMSAFAWGGNPDLPEATSPDSPYGTVPMAYHVMGVGLALAEVDVLTGERRVLRSDILFDLGRPVNPAVDLGQVEGAFVQGMGMMMQEKVTYDSTTGSVVQNSTWSYKPPAVTCVPQQLNVRILCDAPLTSGGPVGSKACGEPPLLLSVAVLTALQRATAAARSAQIGSSSSGGGSGYGPLSAPATAEKVRAACGELSAAELLKMNL